MEIRRIWFHNLPEKLPGNVVVVDAYAASANMSTLLSKKPNKLIIVNEESLERASGIYEDAILVGESDSLPSSEFLFNNQPVNMYQGDVTGKNVLWMSVNGSRVFEETMKHAEIGEVLAGAFNNSRAVTEYLNHRNGLVYIVMAGNRGIEVTEDRICGEILERRLKGEKVDWEEVKKDVSAFLVENYDLKEARRDLPYIVDRIDEFNIVPRCFKNKEGFLEIKSAF